MNETNPLAQLNYIKSNFPNVFVHYGEFKSIRLDKKSSAYLTEGNIDKKIKVGKSILYPYRIPQS